MTGKGVRNTEGVIRPEITFQAPESMKSVLQAAWLLTVAFGNLIVILIAHAKAFNDQV